MAIGTARRQAGMIHLRAREAQEAAQGRIHVATAAQSRTAAGQVVAGHALGDAAVMASGAGRQISIQDRVRKLGNRREPHGGVARIA